MRSARYRQGPLNTNFYETYAQCNEDLIVEGLIRAAFAKSGRPLNTMKYIELGANHPVQTSSTYLFYRLHGASGVLCEANPQLAEQLRAIRPRDTIVNCAVTTSWGATIDLIIHEKHELSSVLMEHIDLFGRYGFGGREAIRETVSCTNMHINAFMQQYGANGIDYLSIDLEGLDLDILRNLDPTFAPTIIQCEYEHNATSFSEILVPRGYVMLALTDFNAIFVHKEALD